MRLVCFVSLPGCINDANNRFAQEQVSFLLRSEKISLLGKWWACYLRLNVQTKV
ncbi:MAG TPA: hypothetical protein VE971_00810 [Candidatus Eisenbacteria bacterium]|nr:hypothetical protein [Candidatus Eisenbacteria bacterium]